MKQPVRLIAGGLIFVVCLAIVAVLLTSNPIHQPKTSTIITAAFDMSQTERLRLAHKIGREFNLAETVQAIMLQETQAGEGGIIGNKDSPVGKRSYGLMQIQVIAAKSVMIKHPPLLAWYFKGRQLNQVADEEIISLLISNDEANIRIGTLHLHDYLAISDGKWETAVAGYNEGIGKSLTRKNPGEFGYVVDVKQKMRTVVKSFNQRENLQAIPRT